MTPTQQASPRVGVLGITNDAAVGLVRRPARTLLCALATAVAIAAFVTINGLTESARGAVSASFNVLRATTVQFTGGTSHDPILSEQGVGRLRRLNGTIDAGLLWSLNQGQPINVARGPDEQDSSTATPLAFTSMSASALTTIGATTSSGRLYDTGADLHHEMVALLGASAAAQLGITSVIGSPAIFVGRSSLTVLGIVRSAQQEDQALLGVIVPPYAAAVIAGTRDQRQVIARTTPGAAQLIGRQGPYALDPYEPGEITAEVPPDPSTLKASVEKSITTLLGLLGLAGLGVGILTITSITMLSVSQRRSEIGLRRAIGYSRREIAGLIATEAAGVGILGGILGVAIGVITTVVVAQTRSWTPVLATGLVAVAPIIGLLVGMLAGAYPAIQATRITPMSALRS